MWGQIFTFIAAILCLYFVYKHLTDRVKSVKYVSSAALLIWILMHIFYGIDLPHHQNILDMIHITGLALVLVTLLLIIRYLRPEIFRYPYVLAFAPLLIPVAQLLVIDTHLIKDIIVMSTQGVAIFVFVLLMMSNKLDLSARFSIIVSAILLIITFILVWFLSNNFVIEDYLWQILLSAGMILGVYTFTRNIEMILKPDK